MKKMAILGFGLSGQAALKKAYAKGCTHFLVIDQKVVDLNMPWIVSLRAVDNTADHRADDFEKKQLIVESLVDDQNLRSDLFQGISCCILSPGVGPTSHALQLVEQLNVPILGEMDFGLEDLKGRKVIVTGSNGKSTTVSLTAHLLQAYGLKAYAVGNIGLPLSAITESHDEDIWIVEASSYQLERLSTVCFDLGVVLNISENHLDRYGAMSSYVQAKAQIQKGLKEEAFLCLDESTYQRFKSYWFWPNLKVGNEFLRLSNFDPFLLDKAIASNNEKEYKFELSYDVENIKVALAICTLLGVDSNKILNGLLTYKKLAHRMEFLDEVEGVSFVNDSKSTSVAATLHALQSIDQSLVLIAGGVHKGASYQPWRDELVRKGVAVCLIGQATEQIKQELMGCCPIYTCSHLAEAVQQAFESAKQKNAVVIFSPGCSSFDMFKNFEDRGHNFKTCIEELKSGGAQ